MSPTTEVRVPITLDKERFMLFDANTMCAYEEATGKFFLDTIASLHSVMRPYLQYRIDVAAAERAGKKLPLKAMVTPADVMRKVSMVQLRALLWASLHEYKDGEPIWPLTIGQVGHYLKPRDMMNVFTLFLVGQTRNSPSKDELGESQAPPKSEGPAPTIGVNGGEPSIELPQDAFPSVT